jgi:hypothetical protein
MRIAHAGRGEVIATLGGVERRLCLTLGALAELEAAFGVTGTEAVAARLSQLSPSNLPVLLGALLRGAGEAVEGLDQICAAEALPAVMLCFKAALS